MSFEFSIPKNEVAVPVVTAGHPSLRAVAAAVPDPADPAIRRLGNILRNSLAAIGGVGLAAPQIGIGLRVVLFEVPACRLTGDEGDLEQGPMVLVNPSVSPLGSEAEEDWEGCLSLPGLCGRVRRPRRIRYRGITPTGEVIDRQASGFHARVVQHECDHLDGILYPQRMVNMQSLIYAVNRVTAAELERAGS